MLHISPLFSFNAFIRSFNYTVPTSKLCNQFPVDLQTLFTPPLISSLSNSLPPSEGGVLCKRLHPLICSAPEEGHAPFLGRDLQQNPALFLFLLFRKRRRNQLFSKEDERNDSHSTPHLPFSFDASCQWFLYGKLRTLIAVQPCLCFDPLVTKPI